MALQYINIEDVKNIQFQKYSTLTQSGYIDEANEEIQNLGEQMNVMTPADITIPVHYVIERYGINYALSRMAEDAIGANESPIQDNDIYVNMFQRTHYIMNELRPQITYQVLTGNINNASDRSASFGTLERA